jgi:hypothetical protein
VKSLGLGSFCYAKEKNVPAKFKGEYGYEDIWTWVAICADTKIVPCWWVGRRDGLNAMHFMADLQQRLANRVQLTTDGHNTYLHAVEATFGADIDYAMLVKQYGKPVDPERPETRYSPGSASEPRSSASRVRTRMPSRPATSSGRTSPCG